MSQPPPPPGSERRRTHRVDLLAQVQMRRGDGEVFLLPVGNISVGGAFLKLEPGIAIPDLRTGDRVNIFLDLGSDFTVDIDASVLRIDLQGGPGRAPGIGLMWTSIEPAVVQKLGAALAHLARG